MGYCHSIGGITKAEQYKKLLSEDLQKVADVTFGYQVIWSVVSGHLETLYGQYANPSFCLANYYGSEKYQNQRRAIRRCSDLPLIEMQDIQKMLAEDEAYAETARELLHMLQTEDKNNEMTIKAASLIGITPEKNSKALYQWLIVKDRYTEQECPHIQKNLLENNNLLMLAADMLGMTFAPGLLLEFPIAGCVMAQPRGQYYYRGENAYYRSSRASCFRSKDVALPEAIQLLVETLRLYQCFETLDKFDAVRHWGFCEVNYLALAQHYGFRTQMLDITSDLKTALFFACCKYGEDRKWHPLTYRIKPYTI